MTTKFSRAKIGGLASGNVGHCQPPGPEPIVEQLKGHAMAATLRALRPSLACTALLVLAASPALGQSGEVVGVVPEGAVIDAVTFPDLAPGARIGFRRPDGSTAQVGEGSVLEVREGRALITLKPGGTVQAGDLAVPCADPGSQDGLRASVQSLKTQLGPTGGGSPELQATLVQLDAILDAREAAIRDGACDVTLHDQQIADLSLQLQQMLAAAAGAASPGGVPPPPPPAAIPGAEPGQAPAVGSAPAPPPIGQTGSGTENIVIALQVTQQLLQMAQTAGLIRQPRQSGQQPGVGGPSLDFAPPAPSQALAPNDPGSGSGLVMPPVAVEPPPQQPAPTVGTPSEPAPPPSSSGTAGANPPSQTGPAPETKPPRGRSTIPDKSSPVVAQPPARTSPSGSPPPWWAVTPPRQPGQVAGTPPGTASKPQAGVTTPGGATTPGKGTSPESPSTTIVPGRVPTGSTTTPGNLTATVPPPGQRTATVRGTVRADNGAPIAGALVSAGGKQARTNAQGSFLLSGVPLGRQTILVTAGGFSESKLAVDLTSGEVEVITPILRRTPVPAIAQTPRPAAPPAVAGPTTRVSPPTQRTATVQGVVRADNGTPIPGALVIVGDKQVKTNTQGMFVITGVPLGRQTLLVTAGGFSEGKLAVELTSGELEKVALTLRRTSSTAPVPAPR